MCQGLHVNTTKDMAAEAGRLPSLPLVVVVVVVLAPASDFGVHK